MPPVTHALTTDPAPSPWRTEGLFSPHYLLHRLPNPKSPVWPDEAEADAAFEFRRRDAELTRKIYETVPVLVRDTPNGPENPWGISFLRMFDMTNDTPLFRRSDQLVAEGYYQDASDAGNVYTKGKTKYLPLYECKMVQMYDHRAAAITVNPANVHRPAQEAPTTLAQHQDPEYSPSAQFWIDKAEVVKSLGNPAPNWLLGFKSVTAPTNARSFICSVLPICAVGNSMPVIRFAEKNAYSACLVANLSSFVLDFSARQKIGGQNLNFFLVEQFPVIPPSRYADDWHGVTLADFITPRVLELCYTAHDLKGFAADLGHTGPPFLWDDERRLHLKCQLDALFFHLYGLTHSEAREILDTFPIVKRTDEAKYGGKYRTRDLILGYHNAYGAGNMDAVVKG